MARQNTIIQHNTADNLGKKKGMVFMPGGKVTSNKLSTDIQYQVRTLLFPQVKFVNQGDKSHKSEVGRLVCALNHIPKAEKEKWWSETGHGLVNKAMNGRRNAATTLVAEGVKSK